MDVEQQRWLRAPAERELRAGREGRGTKPGFTDGREAGMDRIVVGVDGSENSGCALRWALTEARSRNATVDAVYAWHVPYIGPAPYAPVDSVDPGLFESEGSHVLTRALEAEDTEGVDVHRVLVPNTAAAALIDAAKDADLLVVGARGRGGFLGLLLGSVSQQVVNHAPCPVVVVPREGDRDDR